MTKEIYIKLFRRNGFNAFPIPNNQKVADKRYQASRTVPNQEIKDHENYGIIPILGKGNCIIDFDDKEKYRKFAEHLISKGYMVIETGRGWHIPVIGLTGNIQKVELFDYNYQPNEKIIEIQGIKHYCVGPGSVILHDKLQKTVTYENKGTSKIFDVKGKDFHDFVDELCIQCKVEGKKKSSTSSYKHLRERFGEGLVPLKGSSNNYFHQAALVCNTNELTREEALNKIKIVYDKWALTDYFTDRPWSNVEAKVNEVYENDQRITTGRKKRNDSKQLDRTGIAKDILAEKEIYSHKELHEVREVRNGFPELINNTLKVQLYEKHNEISKADVDDILFKLEAGSPDLPETNKDEIVFSNCKVNVNTRKISKTKDIADMGFKQYKFLPKSKKNEPKLFLKMLKDIDKKDHPRLFAGFKQILSGRFAIRMTFLQGKTRVGKTTLLNILCRILGNEYAYAVDLKKYLGDRATQSKIINKRLVVFTDIGDWGDLDTLKNQTGEPQIHIREFAKDLKIGVENKIKFFVTANDLPTVPEQHKDAMFGDRLSLVHNIKEKKYKHDGNAFADKVVKEEGEKIISWIINLPPSKYEYEETEVIEKEWNEQAGPEIAWLEANYTETTDKNPHHIKELITAYNMSGVSKKTVGVEKMKASLKILGYGVNYENIINYIKDKPKAVAL